MKNFIKHISIIFIFFLLMAGIVSTASARNVTWTPGEFLGNCSNISDGDIITITGGTANVNNPYVIGASNISIKTNGVVTFDGCNNNSHFEITGSNVTIEGITFTHFKYLYGQFGGAIYWRGNNGIIHNCNFNDNYIVVPGYSLAHGAAIYWLAANGLVENCKFTSNTAGTGGAICWGGKNGTIRNCDFTSNVASKGAAIFWGAKCDVGFIENCKFNSNFAYGNDGGAIYIKNSNNITVNNCNFTSNNASNVGGAIHWDSNNSIVKNCIFEKNFAADSAGKGGAIYVENGENGIIEHCIFKENYCLGLWDEYGGAIYLKKCNNGRICNSKFIDNGDSNLIYGGAICWANGWNIVNYNGVIENCNFTKNKALCGGSIYFGCINGTISNCNFDENTATQNGGAIYWTSLNYDVSADNGLIEHCNFTKNSAINGGAIYWNNGANGTINGCIFGENIATSNGGAIYWYAGDKSKVTNCKFFTNSATTSGGAIYWISDNGIIEYCNFTKNSAISGGSLYLESVNGKVDNCNFTNSSATIASAILIGYNNEHRSDNTTLINNMFVSCTSTGRNKGNVVNNNTRNLVVIGGENALISFVGDNSSIKSSVTIIILENETKLIKENQKIDLTALIMADGVNNTIIGLPFNFTLNKENYTGVINNTNYIANYTANTLGIFTVNGDCKNVNPVNTTFKTAKLLVYRNPANVTLSITNTTVNYGENITLSITAKNNSSVDLDGDITVMIDGKTFKEHINLKNGHLQYNITDLIAGGQHEIYVEFNNTDYYMGISNTVKININPIEPDININITSFIYGENTTVTINVTGIKDIYVTGNVTIKVDEKSYGDPIVLIKGIAICNIADLAVGKHNVTVTFNGDGNYTIKAESDTFNISKAIPTIEINVSHAVYGENATINVTLIDGSKLLSGNVTVKVDGKIIKDEVYLINGKISCNSTILNVGGHNVTVIFNGNANYTNKTFSKLFNISKATPTIDINVSVVKYGANATICINVTGVNNSYVTGKATIKVDGKDYLDSIEIYGFKILNITDLSAKEHNITVEFNSTDDNYGNSTNTTFIYVIKGNTTVCVDANTTVYGNNVTLVIIVIGVIGKTPTGNLTIFVDGEPIHEHPVLMDGKSYWNIAGLGAWTHNITVTYNGDDNYTSSSNNTNVFVEKANPKVNITVDEITYGENATVIIDVIGVNSSYVAGNVTIIVDNVHIPKTVNLVNGTAIWNSTILSTGKHNITVKFNGDENYSDENNATFITVNPLKPKVDISFDAVSYGENATVNITVVGSESIPTGTITLYINGTRYNDTVLIGGKATITVTGLSGGKHEIIANYTSTNSNYTNSMNSTIINVIKANATFNIANATYSDVELIVSLNSTATGNISVMINGKTSKSTVINQGTARVNISGWDLAAGNYIATINYTGDGNYNRVISTVNFTVDKANAAFNIVNATYGDVELIVSLNSTATGSISVMINGKTSKSTVINQGTARVNISGWDLAAGNYIATINYTGDRNFNGNVVEINFTMNKANTLLNIDITKTFDDYVVIISLNLTDAKGNPISGNVTINVTSDSYYSTRSLYLVNGTGSFEIDKLNLGHYNVTAMYDTTLNYKSTFGNNSFSINYTPTNYYLNASNVVKYYLNATQYHVMLIDNRENPIANKKILVTLTSSMWTNSKSYNITTNASGIATLNINLKAGKYQIIAIFLNATPIINNITVKEVIYTLIASDVIKYYKNGTNYTVTVSDQSGNLVVNESVIVKLYCAKWLKPAIYTIKTNSSGVAVLPINLIEGVYSIAAIVGKTVKYNNIAVYPTLTASSITKKINKEANLKAKLVDNQGNPAQGKEVTFTVKDKTYYLSTDVNGVATLPIHLGLGTWSFLIANPDTGATTKATVKVTK